MRWPDAGPARRIATALLAAAWLVAAAPSPAADAPPGDGPMRTVHEEQAALVEAAFASNLALARSGIEVERAAEALAAARARFFPEVSVEARYTRARGGREIEFPAGALLNPAYQTLNELLVAQGEPPRFAPIGDPGIRFQREREQDTRLALRQPLYRPAIPAAVNAQRGLLEGARFERLALAHQLHRDVSVGYLGYLRALRAERIVASAGEVLAENLRVTESLLRNGRVTEDQVLRARAELLAVEQEHRAARQAIDQARRYVNFLLNRPLETPLPDAVVDTAPPAVAEATAAPRRAEIQRLDALQAAALAQADAARAELKPSLSLGVDAGIQGEEYRTGPGYNYIAASLVLSWNLFDGGARRAEASRARLAARTAALAREELARSIELEVRQAAEALATAAASLDTARAREAAARAGLRIATRKRDEGVIAQSEFMDARDTLTRAELNLNLTQFELLERSVELERATGAAVLPPLPAARREE